MSSVSGNSVIDGLSWQKESTPISDKPKDSTLKQEDFFKLLTQQLAYQDPFKPVENDQMIAQMSSFTTADGINNLNKQFENMNALMSSSQALQASSLVGQSVLVQSSVGYQGAGEGFRSMVNLPSNTTNMVVRIENSAGQVVRTYNLGEQQAGNVEINWDGKDADGNPLPAGNYKIAAHAQQNGKNEQLASAVYARVDSVTLGTSADTMALNLQGLGAVRLSDVIEVSNG
ncbi:MAG: flagellar hook assembly protein FlgD [Gammaproteobacteria bacterium]|nr:flagellar hook assembly protein FlgD [Gammaproteobacteria bacterium]